MRSMRSGQSAHLRACVRVRVQCIDDTREHGLAHTRVDALILSLLYYIC